LSNRTVLGQNIFKLIINFKIYEKKNKNNFKLIRNHVNRLLSHLSQEICWLIL